MSMADAIAAPPGFLEDLQAIGMHPGWAKREPAMWPAPRRTYVPAVWRARDARRALTEATAFVSPEFAERRNLILANPILGNSYPSCATMVAAYQLVLAGETARSHRHTPNALRLVLDAEVGMYTLVNGMRIDMAPGDVVLTPQWHWHGHANTSGAPALWIDVLDVPLVQKLENIFFEHHPDTLEVVQGTSPNSSLRLKSADTTPPAWISGAATIGGDQLPTMALTMVAMKHPDCQSVQASIENAILAVVEGAVKLSTDAFGMTTLERGDVAVVPSWTGYSLAGSEEGGVVLRITDAPIYDALGFRDPTINV